MTYRLLGPGGPYDSDRPGSLGGHRRLRVYGRLDCPSAARWIAAGHYSAHRVFFADEQTAKACGYRPCAVCMPAPYARWHALHTLLASLDAQIESLYTDRGIHGVRPRFAYPLIRLAHTGPLTIRELAESLERSHSAMSQTIAAMRREGLVDTEPGADARTRRVTLTGRGRELIPFLEAEWRATEAAVAELDDEVPHPLSAVVTELERALARRPMKQRILARLDGP